MSVDVVNEADTDQRAPALLYVEPAQVPTGNYTSRYWVALCLALVAVRGAWLLFDRTPMLFLGDSMSYIQTGLTGWIPPDRSFLYGYVVRVLGVLPGSLSGLIAFQVACGVVAGLFLAAVILETIGPRPLLAGALGLLWAGIEPLSLLWERYVMAEACALPLFGAFVLCGLRYIRTRRMVWVLLANVAGIAVLAFRLPFVTVAWIAAVMLPVLAMAGQESTRTLVRHLLASLAVTAALHGGYQALYGELSDGPIGYQHAEGAFLLAAWAPLLEPEDFPDPGVGRQLIQSSTCALRDSRSREGQRWSDKCLIPQVEKAVGDPIVANDVARRTAFAIAMRDPLGVALLAFNTWLEFFDYAYVALVMTWDRRETDYDEHTNRTLAEHFDLDGTGLPHLSTPTNRLYYASEPWLLILAGSPILAWLGLLVNGATHHWARTRQGVWISMLATTLIGMVALTAMSPTPRFLHPLGWLAPIWIAQFLNAVGGLLANRRSGDARVRPLWALPK